MPAFDLLNVRPAIGRAPLPAEENGSEPHRKTLSLPPPEPGRPPYGPIDHMHMRPDARLRPNAGIWSSGGGQPESTSVDTTPRQQPPIMLSRVPPCPPVSAVVQDFVPGSVPQATLASQRQILLPTHAQAQAQMPAQAMPPSQQTLIWLPPPPKSRNLSVPPAQESGARRPPPLAAAWQSSVLLSSTRQAPPLSLLQQAAAGETARSRSPPARRSILRAPRDGAAAASVAAADSSVEKKNGSEAAESVRLQRQIRFSGEQHVD